MGNPPYGELRHSLCAYGKVTAQRFNDEREADAYAASYPLLPSLSGARRDIARAWLAGVKRERERR